jgi:hypothetical protein
MGWLVRRASLWRRVIWGPTLAVVTALYGVAAAFAFVRDAVLPAVLLPADAKAWQARLEPQLRFQWYWWVIEIMAALLIVVLEGVFRVVRQEQRERALDRAKLATDIRRLEAEKSNPELVGEILQTTGGHIPERPDDLALFVNVGVGNKGAPSIVDHWRAWVTVNGARREARFLAIPKNATLALNDGRTIVLDAGDAIYEKTMERIETGALTRGWLMLLVEGLNHASEFFVAGNGVDVAFHDFRGIQYSASHVFGADRGDLRYFPGSGGTFRGQAEESTP